MIRNDDGKKNENKRFLFKRGNMTLARLLLAAYDAGPDGISTMKLFEQIGSTGYGQTTLRRAVREGLIRRKEGPSEYGQFPPMYNIITKKGRQLLQSQLNDGE